MARIASILNPIRPARTLPALIILAAGLAFLLLAACDSYGDDTPTPDTSSSADLSGSALALSSTNADGPLKAYIGLFNDNAVAVLNTANNQVLTTIAVPTGPHGLVMTPDGGHVYVSSDGASTVSVIDTVTIEVGRMPHGLAITPDGRQVLAAVFGADQVSVIDTASGRVTGRLPVSSPHNIAISPDGRSAYVASQSQQAPALVVLDLGGMREIGRIPLSSAPRALGFSPDGTKLFFTQAGVDAVEVLDPATNRLGEVIQTGESPHHPIVTATGEYGLVVNQGPGTLTIFDPGDQTVIGTVPVGSQPHWIAPSADGDTAYVTNEGSNNVSVVDVETQQVTATIPVGQAPRKIVLQPELGMAMPAAAHEEPSPRPAPAVVSPTPSPTIAAAASPAPAAAPTRADVRIAGFAFSPATIHVAPGTTVTWTNSDSAPHTTTSRDGAWDSGRLAPGASFSVTLSTPGTYEYVCMIHPFMRGTVVVDG
jgi:YVTN family beta-propeller protein